MDDTTRAEIKKTFEILPTDPLGKRLGGALIMWVVMSLIIPTSLCAALVGCMVMWVAVPVNVFFNGFQLKD